MKYELVKKFLSFVNFCDQPIIFIRTLYKKNIIYYEYYIIKTYVTHYIYFLIEYYIFISKLP